jgi:cytochrome b involved in lipid metabolism
MRQQGQEQTIKRHHRHQKTAKRQDQEQTIESHELYQEIAKLRKEIDRLSWAEQGQVVALVPVPKSTPQAETPRPKKNNLTLPQVPDSTLSKPKNNGHTKRIFSIVMGMVLFIGAVFGVVATVKYMKYNNIQFFGGKGGNSPVGLQELSIRNNPEDCWMVLHGDVYDLTNYAGRHPGGASIITRYCGTDGTLPYSDFHSSNLLKSIQSNKIGPYVADASNSALFSGGSANEGAYNNDSGTTTTTGHNGGPQPSDDKGSSDDEDSVYNNASGKTATAAPTATVPTATTPPAAGTACSDGSCVSFVELAVHNTASDCWVALYGNVYDLTNYARRHPGGRRWVADLAGTDGTSAYKRFHRQSFLSTAQSYLIGPLQTA